MTTGEETISHELNQQNQNLSAIVPYLKPETKKKLFLALVKDNPERILHLSHELRNRIVLAYVTSLSKQREDVTSPPSKETGN